MTQDYCESDWAGKTAQREIKISEELLRQYVDLSGDSSPVHVSNTAAKARGFRGRVAHGLLLGSLISGVVGTQLPGEAGVLQEVKFSFHNPCYLNDEIIIRVRVTEFHESVQALTCSVEVINQAGLLLVKGQFRSGLVREA